MRMDEVAEVRGKDFECSKHLASPLQCTRKAGLCADFTCHMKSRTVRSMALQTPDTISLKNMFFPSAQASPLAALPVSARIGIIYLATSFSLSTANTPFILILFLSISSLTRGQVCPCVASSNRKCIMDVTFLSISTTKSHTPLCSQ